MNAQSQTSLCPLATRFRIAQNIEKSIGALHADGWVHKSARSESIVFFKNCDNHSLLLDFPYSIDFDHSRSESGSTVFLCDNNDEKKLYRHPEIQDVFRYSFSKNHDIYSLVVVLLEITLWRTARNIVNDAIKKRGMEPGVLNASGLHKVYVDRGMKRMAHLMGETYQAEILAYLESKYKD